MIIRHAVSGVLVLGLCGCAHESQVTPSSGHIDIRNTSSAAAPSASIPKPVRNTAVLPPPPKARPKEQTYSVVVNEVPVKEILFALARESKLNIDIHPGIQGRVTLNAVDQTLPAILERLARQVDLTYKIEGNVLTIAPDQPVLRTYKVDYVNMSRDTAGFIGAASEIASTGRSATSNTSGGASSTGSNIANSSRTSVTSDSKNHFWERLESNIKDILAETDKEVIISRTANNPVAEPQGPSAATSAASTTPANGQAGDAAAPAPAPGDYRTLAQQRDEARTEYKTLFAATVIVNPEAGIITVRGTSKQHEKVQEFLDNLMHNAKRQVLIEATIVEVTLNDINQAGIEWSKVAGNFSFSQALGTATIFNPITPGVGSALSSSPFVVGYSSGNDPNDLNVTLRLLRQFGDTKVLSSPKLMVLNNQTAVLKVVDNLVYFTIEAQTNANQTNTQTTFTTTPHTIPVGVVMSVTPQINEHEAVMLNVRPTISQQIRTVLDPNPSLRIGITPAINSEIPVIQVREMESLLQVNSGQTAVLGGLMQDQISRTSDNVPGVYKLPLIGKLFTARNDVNRKTELVIFIRPTVITNASLESEQLNSFKQYLPSSELKNNLDESVN